MKEQQPADLVGPQLTVFSESGRLHPIASVLASILSGWRANVVGGTLGSPHAAFQWSATFRQVHASSRTPVLQESARLLDGLEVHGIPAKQPADLIGPQLTQPAYHQIQTSLMDSLPSQPCRSQYALVLAVPLLSAAVPPLI